MTIMFLAFWLTCWITGIVYFLKDYTITVRNVWVFPFQCVCLAILAPGFVMFMVIAYPVCLCMDIYNGSAFLKKSKTVILSPFNWISKQYEIFMAAHGDIVLYDRRKF